MAVTPRQMFRLDREASRFYGIPSLLLMENAGRCAAEEAVKMMRGKKDRISCVCGSGNNGGDGFVCARHLIIRGFSVCVFFLGSTEKFTAETHLNALILKKMGCPVRRVINFSDMRRYLASSALIIDAVFGIGFTGHPRPPYDSALQAINDSRRPVLSLDVPSGLDARTGKADLCVRADTTITFGIPKTGLFRGRGRQVCGRLLVADISLPLNMRKRPKDKYLERKSKRCIIGLSKKKKGK